MIGFVNALMLDNLSPMWAYIVFILVNSAILGYWIWVLVGWFWKKGKYSGLLHYSRL